jgi:hypothetical protein
MLNRFALLSVAINGASHLLQAAVSYTGLWITMQHLNPTFKSVEACSSLVIVCLMCCRWLNKPPAYVQQSVSLA